MMTSETTEKMNDYDETMRIIATSNNDVLSVQHEHQTLQNFIAETKKYAAGTVASFKIVYRDKSGDIFLASYVQAKNGYTWIEIA